MQFKKSNNPVKRARMMTDDDQGNDTLNLSFSDLMALLLVFFVLFYSLSRPLNPGEKAVPLVNSLTSKIDSATYENAQFDKKKKGVMERLLGAQSVWAGTTIPNESKKKNLAMESLKKSLLASSSNISAKKNLSSLAAINLINVKTEQTKTDQHSNDINFEKQSLILAKLKKFTEKSTDLDISLDTYDGSIILAIGDRVTFEPGSAEIKPQFQSMLIELADSLLTDDNIKSIKVKGHTDSSPISNPLFPSNWELSGARAARVARMLIGQGMDPKIFEVIGYSEFKPEVSNASQTDKAKNRRVEIELITG